MRCTLTKPKKLPNAQKALILWLYMPENNDYVSIIYISANQKARLQPLRMPENLFKK